MDVLCCMQQLSLAISAGFKPTKMIGALFCSVTLMHRSGVHDVMMARLRAHIMRNLKTTDVPPSAHHVKFATALLTLLEWDAGDLANWSNHGPAGLRARERRKAFDDLVRVATGCWKSQRLLHFCPPGCCNHLGESHDKVFNALVDVVWGRLPPIPALKQWTNLYQPTGRFAVSNNICGLFKNVWVQKSSSSSQGPTLPRDLDAIFQNPVDDVTFRATARSRAGKSVRWANHPWTHWELVVVALAMKPAVTHMGYLFQSGALHTEHSVVELCSPSSPALECITFYF